MLASANIRWHSTADIVVVGYGLAGAVAAITARSQGASVLILEKQSAGSHYTPSTMSGGLFLSSADARGAAEYFTALAGVGGGPAWADGDSIRALAEYSAENSSWLTGLGGKVAFLGKAAEHPKLPGAGSIEVWEYRGLGVRMMQLMYEQVRQRQIEVRYETEALRLLTDTGGRVIGVRASPVGGGKRGEVNIRAAKAVILCSGGFEANEEMKLQYLRVYPIYFTGGSIASTGDGIKMAQEVGADLWHMNCFSARLVAKFDEFPDAFPIIFGSKNTARRRLLGLEEKAEVGYIIVDRYGHRYTDDDLQAHGAAYEVTNFDTHKLEYPRVPSYHIFDQRRMESGTLCAGGICGPQQIYHWSRDNMAELRKGWIIRGNTVGELAGQLGIAPAVLKKTVKCWNGYCAQGNDPEFGRDPLELVSLESPPYYAIRLFPGGPNTQGGPRRNSRAQVLAPFGTPIPGLYAAGECGSVYSMLYPVGGGNLAECIAFGRIAGENAVKEG